MQSRRKTTAERLLLDAEEAALLLGITKRMIYKLAKSGELPATRIGRYLKFRRESLLRWIEDEERAA